MSDKVVSLFSRPTPVSAARHYACGECGSPFWRLWTDGSIWCAGCDDEVALEVKETQ